MMSVRSAVLHSFGQLFNRSFTMHVRAVAPGVLRSFQSASPPRDLKWFQPYSVLIPARGIHTAGDKELVEFLRDEIKMEKQNQKNSGKLPSIKGFEIVETSGPNVTLKKTVDSESVTVKFNVNHSVDDTLPGTEVDSQQTQQSLEPKMVSRPSFLVEFNKGGDKTLAIQCGFPPSDEYQGDQGHEETYEDLIEIQDVAVLNKSQEWTDDVYTLSASVMDGNLYDMLMKMLEERGIDADFVDQLVELSTAYEHAKYVDSLERLKEFIDSK